MIPTAPEPSRKALNVVALWALMVSFESRLSAELVELGLTIPGFRLIGELMQAPGGLRQIELARRLGVTPPVVAVSIARLEESGTIYRVQDPTDPDARRVRLSEDATLLAGIDVLGRMENLLFDHLSDEEHEQTQALLVSLLQRLEQAPEKVS